MAEIVSRPPDFVGVGVQKAGTSRWFRLLCDHPGTACDPDLKELHFFDRFWAQPFHDGEVAAYHAHFDAPPNLCVGEWTPRYLFDPWTPPLIAEAAPEAKLLVLVRDPIDRYRSGLTHALAYDGSPPTGLVATEAFARGLYGEQLRRLLTYFPSSQVLVQQYEACVEDPEEELARTFGFLGLDPDFVPASLTDPVLTTVSEKAPLPPRTADALADAYATDLDLLARLDLGLDLDRWPTWRRARSR